MAAYFFDSSALVKFYIEESGTFWVRSFTDAESNTIHVSSLAEVEAVSALTRRLNRRERFFYIPPFPNQLSMLSQRVT